MNTYNDLLQELYCDERQKLENMRLYDEDTKIKFLGLKKALINKIADSLKMTGVMDMNQIPEDVKESFYSDKDELKALSKRLGELVDNEMSVISNEEIKQNVKFPPDEYAEFVFQLIKVQELEVELANKGYAPDGVYEHIKEIRSKRTAT